jgi:class 3 adenylate cyclase
MTRSVDDRAQTFRRGRLLRPIDGDTYLRIGRAPWVLYLLSAISGVPFLLSAASRANLRSLPLAVAGDIATFLIGLLIFALVEIRPGPALRHPDLFAMFTMVVAGIITSLALVAFGPSSGVVAITYPEPVIFAFILFRLRWALLIAVMVGGEAAAVLFTQDGWVGAVGQWAFVVAATIGVSIVAGVITAKFIASTAAEHAARTELDRVNATLQERVDQQVAELERVGQLRRFLAPEVAEAVVSGDQHELLLPHRRRIAVLFCDLRGFTRFAAQVEPEDVMEVLGSYYRVVGEQLRARGATIGGFAGDGIMAYLNDPVPCDDPAGTVVSIACAIRGELMREVAQWRRAGYDLNFGIGVAVGHATLGVIGFEGRQDYTALGTVVNLAARLCAAASPGQILLDPRTRLELDERVRTRLVPGLTLKGFPTEMEVHAVA